MSDCSINAFKPKKLPKTCGHTLVEELHIVQQNCRYERKSSDTESFHCYDITGDFFDLRIVKQAEEFEQHYQQLEQVAKGLFRSIILTKNQLDGKVLYVEFDTERINYFREQLEKLGVYIDD